MAYNLLRCERDQSYLMPPSMRDWLSEGHLAWFIVDAVGQMDLREFYAAYRSDGWGAAAYDPGMMVAILLYAYCLGLRSSRRIARALEEDRSRDSGTAPGGAMRRISYPASPRERSILPIADAMSCPLEDSSTTSHFRTNAWPCWRKFGQSVPRWMSGRCGPECQYAMLGVWIPQQLSCFPLRTLLQESPFQQQVR